MKVLTDKNKIVAFEMLINNNTYKFISFDGCELNESSSFDVRLTLGFGFHRKISTFPIHQMAPLDTEFKINYDNESHCLSSLAGKNFYTIKHSKHFDNRMIAFVIGQYLAIPLFENEDDVKRLNKDLALNIDDKDVDLKTYEVRFI